MTPPEPGDALADLNAAHRQFLSLVADVRPELHRYCARMTGSVADGEDVVQEALATAFYELSQLREVPALRAWLFRIAHHRAIDHLRRRALRTGEPLDESVADHAPTAEGALAETEAVHVALSRFTALAASQRACVILKDVLDHSLEEIAALLDLTIPAVKAALHRGRARLRELAAADPAPPAPAAFSPDLLRYIRLFDARDWDAVRAMLVDDARLDLVSHSKRRGAGQVGQYLTNYSRVHDWHVSPAWLDGREVIAVRRDPADPRPSYLVALELAGGRVVSIRDYRYVPYIARDATFVEPQEPPPAARVV